MRRCTGIIIGMRQCGGCVEIVVDGAEPGAFPIDNSCFRMIASCEGTDWIGRPVEYKDGHMRFLDSDPLEVAGGSVAQRRDRTATGCS